LVHAVSGSTEPLAESVIAHGYRTAVGDYWITFKMTYESDERVIASPLPGMVGVRYPPYEQEVYNSRPAYVFGVRDTEHIVRFVSVLQHVHIPYTIVTRVPYLAILPKTRYVPVLGQAPY
ncbi:MAG TPA: hypothetical protein VK771_12020, partial [Acidimicrobiia bacterium]|nr:hypothetical protein [Acidimicrobiia bacterium]